MAEVDWSQFTPVATPGAPEAIDWSQFKPVAGAQPGLIDKLVTYLKGTPAPATGPSLTTPGYNLTPGMNPLPAALGVGENALAGATGFGAAIPAGLMGAYQAIKSGDIGQYAPAFHDLQSKLTFAPRTEAGQAIQRSLGDVMGAYSKGIVDPLAARAPGPIESAITKTIGEALPMLAGMKSLKGKAPPVAAPSLAARAQAEGITFPPTQVNPTFANKMLEGLAGKISTAQAAAEKNAPIVNKLVAGDMKIEGPLSKDALQQVRSDAGEAYDAIKHVANRETGVKTRFQSDPAYQDAIANLGGDYNAIIKEVPELANPDIETLRGALSKPDMSATTVVELTKKLRYDGGLNYRSQDPAKRALGQAQIDGSNALDAMMERQLTAAGEGQLVQNLRDARILIAKSHGAEKALDESSSNIMAAKLKAQLEKGKPLTGGMRLVAELAQQYPKAVQPIKSSMPGVSPLDYMAGAITGIGGSSLLKGIATVGARPLARALILSGPYQRRMLSARAPSMLPAVPALGALQPQDNRIPMGLLNQ